jgi:menaquinone-dependent protoporphyrinogen oxidase
LAALGLRQPPVEFARSSCDGITGKALVAYASKCGSTGEIAAEIGRWMCDSGVATDVRRAQEVTAVSDYELVVLGSAVRMGRPLGEALDFCRRHREDLVYRPTAYFVACATMKEDTPERRQEAAKYAEPFLEYGRPVGVGLFGGKVDYNTLPPLLRLFLSLSKDEAMAEGDHRNWEAVRAWTSDVFPWATYAP